MEVFLGITGFILFVTIPVIIFKKLIVRPLVERPLDRAIERQGIRSGAITAEKPSKGMDEHELAELAGRNWMAKLEAERRSGRR